MRRAAAKSGRKVNTSEQFVKARVGAEAVVDRVDFEVVHRIYRVGLISTERAALDSPGMNAYFDSFQLAQ